MILSELGHVPVYHVREWSNLEHEDMEVLKSIESNDSSPREEWACRTEPSTCLAKMVSDALVGNAYLRTLSISVAPNQGKGLSRNRVCVFYLCMCTCVCVYT
jgi:hypothetical protein